MFTGGKKEDARVRPAPRLQTRALIFAPGKAYYLGDLTGSVVGYHAVHTFPMYTDRGSMTYGLESEAWGWKLETNKDKYQATTREFQAAYPNLAGVPTESQMIGQ